MSDETHAPEDAERRLSRRGLIHASLAVGATAWVAPVIVDSLVSPAAAASTQAGCYRLLYPVTSFEGPCAAVAPETGCCQPVGYPTASPGTDFATAVPGCISSATGCGNTSDSATFVISADCDCQFVAGTIYSFGGECVLGALSNGNKTVTFADVPCTDASSAGFRLLVSCGGASCTGGMTDTCEGCGAN